jgi:hypothetical protein
MAYFNTGSSDLQTPTGSVRRQIAPTPSPDYVPSLAAVDLTFIDNEYQCRRVPPLMVSVVLSKPFSHLCNWREHISSLPRTPSDCLISRSAAPIFVSS